MLILANLMPSFARKSAADKIYRLLTYSVDRQWHLGKTKGCFLKFANEKWLLIWFKNYDKIGTAFFCNHGILR